MTNSIQYRTKLAGKKVKDIEAFKELLHTHTQFLLGHMKPGSVENINWQAMPVFRYLRDNAVDIYERYYGPIPPAKASTSGASGRQSSIKKEDENDQNTLAKLKTVKKVAKSALKVEESDSDEEMFDAEPAVPKTPAQERPQRQYAGKGSTRRPVTTPATSAGKKNSKTMSDDDEDEEEIVQPDEKRRRISAFPGISGRIATKEKKPKTKKEKSLTAEEKRARRLQETADLPSSHAGSSPEPSDDEAGKPHLALVNVEMGQSIKPNAPNGFWICERPECGHLEIPFAESENGKANIRNHWLWHADDIEKKSGIIHEFAKPYLNTENLVKYFDSLHKKMAEAGVEKPKVDVRVEGAVEKDGKGRVMPRRPKRTGFNVSAEVLSGRTNLPWSADAD